MLTINSQTYITQVVFRLKPLVKYLILLVTNGCTIQMKNVFFSLFTHSAKTIPKNWGGFLSIILHVSVFSFLNDELKAVKLVFFLLLLLLLCFIALNHLWLLLLNARFNLFKLPVVTLLNTVHIWRHTWY